MIYEQDCYNLNVKYFDNLIEIDIKNIPNKFIRFKIYENILHDDKIFINCIFKNDMFLLFLRIYDVIKLIVMTYFLLIAYLKMTYFYYFLRIRNFMVTYFLLIPYLKMSYLCIFYYIVFINPTIKFI